MNHNLPVRVKVACINWGHPDAPHAMTCTVNAGGEYLVTISHDSWAEAMAQADRLADIIRRYWNNHPEGDQA